ncbi:Na(+)-linked D-alanine glycine permease [Aequoribacter fuscus]|uniref:Na(+)-linked D-alanine glycine permease n=1 Tax=Aequoribacter fuscus TaxID=2518989 RepID=F3KY97_9GAMM|nr:alanine/glycine:cation symporter family protein [Aequoribacter fuscus]EGG30953.1 Na(+)-linked D-alanine glycine permease [Aequoribacter fuscus]
MAKISTKQSVEHFLLSGLLLMLSPASALASIDQAINEAVAPATAFISSIIFYSVALGGAKVPLVVVWLLVAAVFFTVYFRFLNFSGFKHAIDIVRGLNHNPKAPGEVTHFQALTTAVSGTVGIGNIGGVAVAISMGGPGATFWLIVAGLLGMSTKFIECTLGTIYRKHNPDGSVSGGPMYYLEQGFLEKGLPNLGKFLGKFYALGIVIGCLGIGNMFQANQAYLQFVTVTGGDSSFFAGKGWLVGLVMAIIVGLVIIGGIKSIARVTSKLVPFMAVFYSVSALIIILMNAEALPFAFNAIIEGAFSPEGVAGGMLGVIVIGVQRAVFSNEAGIGSAPIAHSAVQTKEPITQGYVSMLEPFIDTVVICTLTALVIVTTFYYDPSFNAGLDGIGMTSAAFERNIGWSPLLIAFAGMLFAFSTLIAWAYYGLKGFTYLMGEHAWASNLFKLVFCFFIVVGCSIPLTAVLDFSDALVFLICVPNIIGLYVLAPVAKQALQAYNQKVRNQA